MKTLKTLGLLLLMATGAMAQINPDNMFISGYVSDNNGGAIANHQVCVYWNTNNPVSPTDSLCTFTNANGYYFLDIVNGSVTGPNVTYTLHVNDTCNWLLLQETVMNGQGTIDTATVNFVFCGNGGGCDLEIDMETTVDSAGGSLVYTFSAIPLLGTAPYAYSWSTGHTTQSIMAELPGAYCVTVTDVNGCTVSACDTLLPLNPNDCEAGFTYPSNPAGNLEVGSSVQLFFDGVASNFSTYDWTISGGGLSFSATGMNPVFQIPPTLLPLNGMMVQICVTVSDSISGCSDSYCETILAVPANTTGCQAYFVSEPDSILGAPLPGVWFTDASQGGAFYFWDFGDNTFSTDQNPVHLYNGTGTYYVCLTISSADSSCQDTYCVDVYVGNNNGNCDASFTNSGPTPIGYTFSANVQNPNFYYQWSIDNQYVGDGYEAYSPGFTNGVHTICLTIVDSLNNCFDQQCQTITVGSNNCYGYISGEVYAGSNNQPLDEGMVYLILFDSLTNTLTAIDSLPIDSSNFFFFGPLACGDYLIKAAATLGSQYYNGHIPTYYGNSPFWGFAQTVSIGQVNTQVTTDVTLIAANNPGGPGFIGGDVTQGANKTDLGDPLSGILVMLFDLSGNAIAYTYTDGNGEFGFSNLAYGTYQVYVEALGVQTIPAIVTIGENEPSVDNVQILVSESLISTGIEEFDFDGAISDVYPNPVGIDASIRFNLEKEVMVDISILDLAGRMITTHTVSVAGGENAVSISTGQLKDGYYFLNIQDVDGNFSVTRKFMRVD
ncbi:MAG: carboxypeptidase regulatory-like domain-containing protein [Flavobacteriales bacterium]|nr:carboxypeptidase regulatory-like domain-containing protein [Flavobacteriales bacterium]